MVTIAITSEFFQECNKWGARLCLNPSSWMESIVTVVFFVKLYLRKYIKNKQNQSKPKLKLIGNSFSFLLFIPSINVEFLLLNNKRKQCIIIQVGAMSCWPWIAYFVNLLSELLWEIILKLVYIYIYIWFLLNICPIFLWFSLWIIIY